MDERLRAVSAALSRYRWLSLEVERMEEELCRLRAERLRLIPLLSDAPRGSLADGTKLVTLTERLLELETRLGAAVLSWTEERRQLEQGIARVPDPALRLLLRLYYIDGHTQEETAETMHYSTRHIYNLHEKALASYAKENPPEGSGGSRH